MVLQWLRVIDNLSRKGEHCLLAENRLARMPRKGFSEIEIGVIMEGSRIEQPANH